MIKLTFNIKQIIVCLEVISQTSDTAKIPLINAIIAAGYTPNNKDTDTLDIVVPLPTLYTIYSMLGNKPERLYTTINAEMKQSLLQQLIAYASTEGQYNAPAQEALAELQKAANDNDAFLEAMIAHYTEYLNEIYTALN